MVTSWMPSSSHQLEELAHLRGARPGGRARRSAPASRAQRRWPSMIMATCFGIDSRIEIAAKTLLAEPVQQLATL